jgi:hypothetical protein
MHGLLAIATVMYLISFATAEGETPEVYHMTDCKHACNGNVCA